MKYSFSDYLIEAEGAVYFTFGRMNPPTEGHGKLLDKLSSSARNAPYMVFLSQTNDKNKNPLQYKDKIKFVRKMFPKHARQIILDTKIKTPMHALDHLYNKGYKKVVMIAGSDRVVEWDLRLNKYNGKKRHEGFYNFEGGIKVVSAGIRDPDSKDVEGYSGTKQRESAKANDFQTFSLALPRTMSDKDAKTLFNTVRTGMGLKEEKAFKNHVEFNPVSETREAYVSGDYLKEGDKVIVKDSEEICKVTMLGANYVIVESSSGKRSRKWLDAVELLKEKKKDQPEEGTPAATEKMKKAVAGQQSFKAYIGATNEKV